MAVFSRFQNIRLGISTIGLALCVFAILSGCQPTENAPQKPKNEPITSKTTESMSTTPPAVLTQVAEIYNLPLKTEPAIKPIQGDTAAAVKPIETRPTPQKPHRLSKYNPLRAPNRTEQKDPPSKVVPSDKFGAGPARKKVINSKPPLVPINDNPKIGKDKAANSTFNPIKANGPIFVDWPCPALALVITGRMDGYVEPCGCAGLDRMKGGLSRRATMIKQLREKRNWPVLSFDVGNLIKGYGRQAELKFQMVIEAFLDMDYDAIGLGKYDLGLPAGELAAVTAGDESPFVSANIGLFDFDSELIGRVRKSEANGICVASTAVLGESFRKQVNNNELTTIGPVEAIKKVLPELEADKPELMILLAFANTEETIALAKQFPQFQIVVTAGGPAEPPNGPKRIAETGQYFIEVGDKGMDAIVMGYYPNEPEKFRYQRVPLDSRFPASKIMGRLMAAYQQQLKMHGLDGLHIHPVELTDCATKGPFIGSEKCEVCHEQSYDVWKKSGHAKGWETLEKTPIPRNHDPECISCHVIGWHPTKHFPYKGGFTSSAETPHLENVGCESCHGPGGAHAKAELATDEQLQEKLRKAMVITLDEAQNDPGKMCYNCHDLDNSPDFNFETYWPKVFHKEETDD
jgi:Cytochrome c554 and c-prime